MICNQKKEEIIIMTLKCEISKVYNIMLTKKLTIYIYIYITESQ